MKKMSQPSFSEECRETKIAKESGDKRSDNCAFADEECSADLRLHQYFECTFTRVNFSGRMDKMEFADVIFDHCNLDNIVMSECSFRRVIFKQCRLTGCDLSGSSLQDVWIESCQGNYINMNLVKIQNGSWKECGFQEGAFGMMKVNGLTIEKCDFTSSEWVQTRLQGLDFSDSVIDGIAINPENLKGVIVSDSQAVVLAKLLGIVVK